MKKIGFYCEHAFGLYDIKPIFEKYKSQNYIIFIITLVAYKDVVLNHFDIAPQNIIFIDKYKTKLGGKFTQWYRALAIKISFSEFYFQRSKIKYSKTQYVISKFFLVFKVSNKKVNKRYYFLSKILIRIGLIKSLNIDFDKLFVLSKVHYPYLLVPFKSKTHLIIESWDHPAKEPFLIDAKVAYGWNKDLNNELRSYQNYKQVYKIFPLKFRYILENNRLGERTIYNSLNSRYYEDLNQIDSNNTYIYPMCTSSDYFAFEGEYSFVKDLALKLSKEGFKLYIRPYPLAPKSDRDQLLKIKNVVVGIGNELKDGLEVFDVQHQNHKYLAIKKAKGIINVGTTFVFDAALVEKPKTIIQLIINDSRYGNFSQYSKGVHIKKYLHNQYAVNFERLEFNDPKIDSKIYRNAIVKWLLDE